MIMLEGIDVCPIAWYTIMDVSKATYYHWKVNANNGMRASHHSNVGLQNREPIHYKQQLLCVLCWSS
jgi:hypothetical protein